MENIETLLAAVAQTQGFDDDEPVVSTPPELGLRNSMSAAATQLVAGVSGDVRHSPVVETAVPAPASASPAVGMVIGEGGKRKRGRPPRAQLAGNPPPPKRSKVEDAEEDVCFICFDGGSLVLCDRKGCPKAYHPACIKRDEAFFQSKAKWNCGWHICSVCQKASYYMCYTCSYSLCKACTKNEDYVCVRGNKGFCSTCIKPIMLIENKDQASNESIQVDFDDKFSWEYLFKMYWLLLKEKLSLTLSEITQAKNPWKDVATEAWKPSSINVLHTTVDGQVSMSCRSSEHLELNKPRLDSNLIQNDGLRTSSNVEKLHSVKGENGPSYNKDTVQQNMDRVTDEMSTDRATDEPLYKKVLDDSSTAKDTDKPCIFQNRNTRESDKPAIGSIEWASKELLEFVAHMKNGDTSAISQFDVQTLLLEYIKRNNLRDPRRKSQIICDLRLTNLFGKPRVGHIEMLKLLEFHFLIKENSHKNSFIPAGFVSSMVNDVESDGKIFGLATPVNSRKRKTRKKSEDRAPQQDVNEYAAIDVHNINLIYLRRNLMENLIDDRENFNDKVIGSIVRIRISTNDQKPEVHRLVQVVGTSKVPEPYKIGARTADVMLEVLNLDKKEVVSIDAISNQELTEEECRRLRQSIRCGLVKHFTVGDIQKKAVALQSVRVNDWLEAEVSRLNHLRDRASEKGHKKELRECVERLQLLKSPEERKRKISEVPEIHADPKMSPNYESEEDNRSGGDGKKGEYVRPSYTYPRNGQKTHINKKGKEGRSAEVKNRKIEKADASGSSSLDKHMNRITIGTSPNDGRNDHDMQRSGLETSTAASCVGNSPSADNIETEKLWHYRDPNGKIQGSFSMMQLRKWSTTGLFPPDMRIWTKHEQYDSLLLIDVLSGKFHTTSNLSHALSSCSHENKPTKAVGVREGTNEISRDNKQTEAAAVMKADESGTSGWPQCWDLFKDSSSSGEDVKACNLPPSSSPETGHAALTDRCQEGDDFNRGSQTGEKNSIGLTQSAMTIEHELQSRSTNEDQTAKPSEENLRSLNIDLSSNDIKSGSVFAPVSESANSSKQTETTDVFDLPSPTPKTQNQLPISADVPAQNSGVLELLSPSPRSSNENQEAHATETKQSGFINLPVSSSGPGWNDVQLPEVADEWCGYSPTPARSSIQEWDPGQVSATPLKPLEVKNEIMDTSIPNGHQEAHDSSSHPVSNWLAILNEPIEFVALGEDSVSDLLAEVDALESQGALPSPTAAIKFARELLEDSKDDCFSSIEEFSSAHEPRRSDALSSTGDVHLTSQSLAQCKPNGTSPVDAFDIFRRSSVNSAASSEGETNAPVHSSDASSEIHPLALRENMAPVTGTDPTEPGRGTALQGNINLVTVQGNVNLVLGGPAQGMTNLGWGTNPGSTWANPSSNRSPRNGSLQWDGQRKHGGERFHSPREWGYQGGEAGFGRGRPPWGRQTYGGGGRPLPKGQRVCKFYEGGHCKKGAFCDYLHP